MMHSENIAEIAAALAKAQSEMQNPQFDSKNPHFKSSYASLASVRNAVVPVLAKHGISVMQDVVSGPEGVTCTQMLMHSSGQWIRTSGMFVPVDKANAHGYGSATTYARRFSLMALACVVGDDDDDGNAAVQTAPPVQVNQELKKAIAEAETLDALVEVWTKIPRAQQVLLTADKDNRKAELQKATAKQEPTE